MLISVKDLQLRQRPLEANERCFPNEWKKTFAQAIVTDQNVWNSVKPDVQFRDFFFFFCVF